MLRRLCTTLNSLSATSSVSDLVLRKPSRVVSDPFGLLSTDERVSKVRIDLKRI
jgi:hypothetical protein